jgi:hypothetical protein
MSRRDAKAQRKELEGMFFATLSAAERAPVKPKKNPLLSGASKTY